MLILAFAIINALYLGRLLKEWLVLEVSKGLKSPSRGPVAHRAALISVSVTLSQTPDQPKLQVRGHGASVSRGVPIQLPACAGTKLYCLVNGGTCVWTTCPELLHVAERTRTCDLSRLQVRRPDHYATTPHRGNEDTSTVSGNCLTHERAAFFSWQKNLPKRPKRS